MTEAAKVYKAKDEEACCTIFLQDYAADKIIFTPRFFIKHIEVYFIHFYLKKSYRYACRNLYCYKKKTLNIKIIV